jgi:two-component system cell cycle response regulator
VNIPSHALKPRQGPIESIAFMGLSHDEARVVQHTLAVVRARGLVYSLVPRGTALGSTTLVIVDGTHPGAVTQWKLAKEAYPHLRSIVIVDSGLTGDCPADRVLKRPLSAHNLIAALGELEILHKPVPRRGNTRPGGSSRSAHRREARKVLMSPPIVVPAVPERAPRLSGRVLVVGEGAVRRQLSLVLTHLGLKVQTTQDSALGLRLADSGQFDAVLLDTLLPDADAYEMCRSIKHNRAQKRIPVLILTSKLSTMDRIRGSLVGCDGHLVKPIRSQPLEEALAKHLRTSQQGTIAAQQGERRKGT